MSDEDDIHSSDDCRTFPRPNQPESFVTLMGDHYVDPLVSGQLKPTEHYSADFPATRIYRTNSRPLPATWALWARSCS
jgi:hypothetical protein